MKKRFALVWCSEEERFDYKEEMLKAFEMPNSDWHLVSAFSEMEDVIDFSSYVKGKEINTLNHVL